MGGLISFLSWLFTDPVSERGRPQLFLSSVPAFTVRKRQSNYSDIDEKIPLTKCGERETEVVSMRGFFATRCPAFLKKYDPTWWLPK
jgi:hypothetical protein